MEPFREHMEELDMKIEQTEIIASSMGITYFPACLLAGYVSYSNLQNNRKGPNKRGWQNF